MLLNLAKNSSLLVLMGTHLNYLLKESRMGGGECLKGMHRVRNSEVNMVMDNSDVVDATGGTVGVGGRVAKVASSMGTDGVVSAGSSPCSNCGGTGGATNGGALRCAK